MSDDELKTIIGQNITTYRIQANLTQAQLAELVGVSPAFVSLVERGKKRMRISTLLAMSQALHVSCDALLSPEGPEAHRDNILYMLSQQSPENICKIERVIRVCMEEFGAEPPSPMS